jgi:hypothetical protein
MHHRRWLVLVLMSNACGDNHAPELGGPTEQVQAPLRREHGCRDDYRLGACIAFCDSYPDAAGCNDSWSEVRVCSVSDGVRSCEELCTVEPRLLYCETGELEDLIAHAPRRRTADFTDGR